MNKVRCKEISGIIEQLSALRDQIEQLQEEEQEAFDNLPEGVQLSDRGDSMEAAVEALGNACDELDSVTTSLEEASGA